MAVLASVNILFHHFMDSPLPHLIPEPPRDWAGLVPGSSGPPNPYQLLTLFQESFDGGRRMKGVGAWGDPRTRLLPYQLPRAGAIQGKLRLGAYLLCVSMFTSLDLPRDCVGNEPVCACVIHSFTCSPTHPLASSSTPCPEESDMNPSTCPQLQVSPCSSISDPTLGRLLS